MDKVATLSDIQRGELFKETGLQRGLQAAIIEKDFWVCWTLGHIFNIEQTRDVLQFKGGTALAKVFHLIERFSEDIDLVIDYAPLGFVGPRDPMSDMSRTKRERLLSEMMTACHLYCRKIYDDSETSISRNAWRYRQVGVKCGFQ